MGRGCVTPPGVSMSWHPRALAAVRVAAGELRARRRRRLTPDAVVVVAIWVGGNRNA